jgi:hypothetical protein
MAGHSKWANIKFKKRAQAGVLNYAPGSNDGLDELDDVQQEIVQA